MVVKVDLEQIFKKNVELTYPASRSKRGSLNTNTYGKAMVQWDNRISRSMYRKLTLTRGTITIEFTRTSNQRLGGYQYGYIQSEQSKPDLFQTLLNRSSFFSRKFHMKTCECLIRSRNLVCDRRYALAMKPLLLVTTELLFLASR